MESSELPDIYLTAWTWSRNVNILNKQVNKVYIREKLYSVLFAKFWTKIIVYTYPIFVSFYIMSICELELKFRSIYFYIWRTNCRLYLEF